jgi:hypothetical protein
MKRNPLGWHYPPGAEHDPRAPYNQGPAYPDLDEVLDILDRARGFEDALDELINHFDNPPAYMLKVQTQASKITDYLRSLADDIEEGEL